MKNVSMYELYREKNECTYVQHKRGMYGRMIGV